MILERWIGLERETLVLERETLGGWEIDLGERQRRGFSIEFAWDLIEFLHSVCLLIYVSQGLVNLVQANSMWRWVVAGLVVGRRFSIIIVSFEMNFNRLIILSVCVKICSSLILFFFTFVNSLNCMKNDMYSLTQKQV